MTLNDDPLYTIPEVAAYLRIARRTVYALIERQELKAVGATNNLMRIKQSELKRYVDRD